MDLLIGTVIFVSIVAFVLYKANKKKKIPVGGFGKSTKSRSGKGGRGGGPKRYHN